MLTGFPQHTGVVATTSNCPTLSLGIQTNARDCPPNVYSFLMQMGWSSGTVHPDTSEPMFQKFSDENISTGYFTWSEAMIYEWFRVLSVGG